MTAQWYELKLFLEDAIKKAGWPMTPIYYYRVLNEMNEIESKHACQSLKEAGY